MKQLYRLPVSREPTIFLIGLNLVIGTAIYENITAEYVIFSAFVIAITAVAFLWWMERLQKITSQGIAVISFFTLAFNMYCTALDEKVGLSEMLFIRIVSGLLVLNLFSSIPKAFPKSFSKGELVLVLQLVVPVLAISFSCSISYFLHQEHEFCSGEKTHRVLRLLCVGTTLFVLSDRLVIWRRRVNHSSLMFPIFLFVVASTYQLIFQTIKREPLLWLFGFVTRSEVRRSLMVQWATCFAVCISFTVVWTWFGRKTTSTVRKTFHFAISFVFVTGIKQSPELLSFCSAGLLLVFIILEYFRISRMWLVSGLLNQCVNSFRDEKDAGILTLTHMYLLIGVSLPLWLLPAGNPVSLPTFSGVIAIGFGDTAASIVGSHFGRHKWSGSEKSIEGSVAAVVAQILSSILIGMYLNPNVSMTFAELTAITIISVIVSLIEAKTSEIDNLTLPLYHNTLMLLAKIFLPNL